MVVGMTMPPVNRRGFTLVEAIIVIAVIATLLAFLIPIIIPVIREWERQRLQALADSEPWEVFELHAAPAKESFAEDEDIILDCVMVNLTDYPLTAPSTKQGSIFVFEGTDYFMDNVRAPPSIATPPNLPYSSSTIAKMLIGPGESVRFKVHFLKRFGVGSAEVRVAYWDGRAQQVKPRGSKNRPAFLSFLQPKSGILPSSMRFQSNPFQLVVKAKEKTELHTFNEIIEELTADEITAKRKQRE